MLSSHSTILVHGSILGRTRADFFRSAGHPILAFLASFRKLSKTILQVFTVEIGQTSPECSQRFIPRIPNLFFAFDIAGAAGHSPIPKDMQHSKTPRTRN